MKKTFTANTLKLIAIIAMLIDHIAYGFLPEDSALYYVMRIIGKLTMPIMCYFVAEGYYHTRNVKKYMLRMLLFAVISHVPYRLFAGSMDKPFYVSSVMLPLFFGLLSLWIFDSKRLPKLLSLSVTMLLFLLSFNSDWMGIPVIFIMIFGVFRGDKKIQLGLYSLLCIMFCVLQIIENPVLWYMLGLLLAVPVLYLYSGELGKKSNWIKWSFYAFYPLHLLVLYAIKTALQLS